MGQTIDSRVLGAVGQSYHRSMVRPTAEFTTKDDIIRVQSGEFSSGGSPS